MVGQLTKTLTQVQTELERQLEALENVLRELEGGKQSLISGVISVVAPDIINDHERRQPMENQIEDNLAKSLHEIAQARTWIGRLNNVARNGLDIAKKVEQTWYDTVKKYVEESRWYRENFPLEYERKQREREYERYRLRPETFYGKPSADEMRYLSKSNPELFKDIVVDKKSSLQRKAQVEQLDKLIEEVEVITKDILALITTYFSADSPILAASTNIVSKLKSERARKINPTLTEALGDEVQALEALFGSGEYPGKFITSGNKVFLIPAIRALQEATQRLSNPVQQVGETKETTEEIGKSIPEEKPMDLDYYRQWNRDYKRVEEAPPTEARRNVLLERRNIIANRKKRCHITQRIASSSREKEEFSNG